MRVRGMLPKLTLTALAAVSALLALAHPGAPRAAPAYQQDPAAAAGAAAGARQPVLVELYTSEGCSSCPPADQLLIELDRSQPVAGAEVIVLGLHVDYWDRQGWVDRFSSSRYTARQHDYAAAFGNATVYTPQMIVDGAEEFIGSDRARAWAAIARAAGAPKVEIRLSPLEPKGSKEKVTELRLAVEVGALPGLAAGDEPEVLLAITESGLASDVADGENAGRRMEHTSVVRDLWRLGRAGARHGGPSFTMKRSVKLDPRWRRDQLRAVVFVQEYKSRRVLAAAALPLGAH